MEAGFRFVVMQDLTLVAFETLFGIEKATTVSQMIDEME